MPGIANLKKMLKYDEGERLNPYFDTVGKLTIGVGRNLDDVGISHQESDILLDSDITRLLVNPEIQRIINGNGHSEVRQAVILDMAFNLGIRGLMDFRNMLSAFENSNYDIAAVEMLDSKWADQVGHRATRLAYMMKTGEIHEDYL